MILTIMRSGKSHILILLFILVPMGIDCGQSQEIQTKEQIISTFTGRTPREWGEVVRGVKTRLNTEEKVLALTFDACGGRRHSGYDAKLIHFLETEKVSATLFISGRWIEENAETFKRLSKNPLLEIENHGLNHKPCSAIGRPVYGIEGTKSVEEIYDEIELNALKILNLTGRKPKYYRPAAAYSDEICVRIANALGYQVVNFSILGDAGATYSKRRVKEALSNAPPSSIILLHMNHPESESAEGLIEAIPELKKRRFRFVKVSEFGLR
jgi:peptidoglycan/xylan/chitin deacetylase (PgdA/CDA1 family)